MNDTEDIPIPPGPPDLMIAPQLRDYSVDTSYQDYMSPSSLSHLPALGSPPPSMNHSRNSKSPTFTSVVDVPIAEPSSEIQQHNGRDVIVDPGLGRLDDDGIVRNSYGEEQVYEENDDSGDGDDYIPTRQDLDAEQDYVPGGKRRRANVASTTGGQEGEDGVSPKKRRKESKPKTPRQPRASASGSAPGTIRCDFTDTQGKECGTMFRRPYDLARHKETIHSSAANKPVWKCETCEHSFSRKDALLRHCRQRHGGK